MRSNFHTHTRYCDGSHTVEEMVQAAVSLGMRALGFSGHSYTAYDDSYCMSQAGTEQYLADVLAARERYAGRLEIYLGVEDDYHGGRPQFPRDFTIGSAHCVLAGGRYFSVDADPALLQEAVDTAFGGDIYRLTAAYFAQMACVQERTGCDVIGHFDLVAKFNEHGRFFEEEEPRYWKPALEAIEHLCRQNGVFEINTGAMSRGYRSVPYPSRRLLQAVHEFGGAIVLSSDSHSADTLCAYFPEAEALAASCGFRTCRTLTPGGWQEVPLDSDF